MKLNILCIGDVVGRPGRRILAEKLKPLVKELNVDCVIVNAENAAGGSGLTPQIYNKLLRYGTNLITLGDHTYRKRDIIETLERADNIVRPENFSTRCQQGVCFLQDRQRTSRCDSFFNRPNFYEAGRMSL